MFKEQQACWYCHYGSLFQCLLSCPLGPPLLQGVAAVDSWVRACLDSIPYEVPPRGFFGAVETCSAPG